ncbi:MAG TPA: histidinol-phosphatase [Sphaerochaeta sp.]|nr:histidinol-phosphatase [Sphaerochaeta sp.]
MNIQTYTQEVVNLHTHSYYCGHGFGEVAEYAQEGLKQGLQLLGMSEHCPVPDNRWGGSRMPYSMLDSYTKDCLATKDEYAGRLEVLRGFECDYLPQYKSYYEELRERSDYLFFAIHDLSLDIDDEYSMFWNPITKDDLFTYTEFYLKGIESGIFLFGAHPDVFCHSYRAWDDESIACSKAIIECAIANDVALEINGNGMRKRLIKTSYGSRYPYPHHEFWKLASQYPVKVLCNSDAHKPSHVNDSMDLCLAFAKDCGIAYSSFQVEKVEGKGSGGKISLIGKEHPGLKLPT